jgi:hypothetical protein
MDHKVNTSSSHSFTYSFMPILSPPSRLSLEIEFSPSTRVFKNPKFLIAKLKYKHGRTIEMRELERERNGKY